MRRYFVVLATISFAVNWMWEMAQMFAYEEMAARPWSQTVLTCTIATLGDVVATLLVLGLIALMRRGLPWTLRPGWADYGWAGVFGAAIAVAIEKVAIANDQWSYTQAMPLVPVLEVGLLPLLQLAVLIPLTLWGAALSAGDRGR